MTNEAFSTILELRISAIRDVLAAKAKEYATTDRLHNFKRSAAMLNTTPEAALVGFLTKHIVSILDMVDALPHPSLPGGEEAKLDQWREKLGDAINYLILLEALVSERAEAS